METCFAYSTKVRRLNFIGRETEKQTNKWLGEVRGKKAAETVATTTKWLIEKA